METLDILDERPGDTTAALGAVEGATAGLPPPASTTVLDLDRWGLRRGHDLAAEWKEQTIGDHSPETVADAHGALFEPEPQFADQPQDASRAAWWRQLMETPEYRALHQQTMLDSPMAGLAAKALCDQWAEYAAQQPEPKDGDPTPGSDAESIGNTIQRIRSTAEALTEAGDAVQTAKDVAAGLGMGEAGQPLNSAELLDYYRKVRSSDFLRRLFAWAGRAKTLASSLQRRKVRHGRDDMVGVTLGGDLARILPSELAQMACGVPELELLATYRLVQRQALCREYRGIERVGRGPIVVVVDESGSMSGDPIIAAKGLALALAWLARHQRRWMALVGFAGGTEGHWLVCPPGRMDQSAVLDWLVHFYGGGTTLDVPLAQLPNVYWPAFVAQGLQRGKTDVVIITDAIVDAPAQMVTDYLAWAKAETVKTYGIVIGQQSAGDLAQACTRHWCVPDLELNGAATEAVLSI